MQAVFLHGLCESGALWDEVTDRLRDIPGLQIYSPDIPGFGSSIVLEQEGIDRMASFLLKDLTLRNISKFAVFGHSMGGYIALEMLHQDPKRITKLGLINSTVRDDDDLKRKNRTRVIKFIQKNGVEKYVSELAHSMLSPDNATDRSIWAKLMSVMHNNNSQGTINALRSMALRKDHTETLKDCPVPVLLAGGKEDGIVPPSRMFDEAMLPITCSVKVLDNAGHCLPVERPARLAELIRVFLTNEK